MCCFKTCTWQWWLPVIIPLLHTGSEKIPSSVYFTVRERGPKPSPSIHSSEATVSLQTSELQEIKQISSTVTVFAMLIFALSSPDSISILSCGGEGTKREFLTKTLENVHLIRLTRPAEDSYQLQMNFKESRTADFYHRVSEFELKKSNEMSFNSFSPHKVFKSNWIEAFKMNIRFGNLWRQSIILPIHVNNHFMRIIISPFLYKIIRIFKYK